MFRSANLKSSQPSANIASLLIALWNHLESCRHRQLVLMLLLMLGTAISEMISLGAVLPFIGVLTAPDKVLKYRLISQLAEIFGINSPDQLVTPLAIGFAFTALIAGCMRLLLLWASARLSNSIGADLSSEMYRRTLYQPYRVHAVRNSSEVIDGITNKSWIAMSMLQAVLTLTSSILLLLGLMVALLAIDLFIVSLAFVVFGVSYGLITWVARRKLEANSQLIARQSASAVKALQEGLGAIRDVLLNWTQPVYCETYREADVPYRQAYGSNMFIAVSPRYVMEAVGMVLIAALAFVMSRKPGGLSTALPLLGALALGAQRIIPALQQIYSAWANLAGNQASLVKVIDLLDQPIPSKAIAFTAKPIQFRETIRFESVYFRYFDHGPWILENLDLTIPKGFRLGLVGSTGSGKTTVLDLLMGLLEPTKGRIFIDGMEITGKLLRSWQQAIAHVPQSIFLTDATLAENIALGHPKHDIDMDLVRQVCIQAQIADFVESRPRGYNALVGERGVMLSGGQRQKIGIARALYKQASVLVFDEATSSLDNETERAVMKCIENLHRGLTILISAHRLSTIQNCDKVVELAGGRVVAMGTYHELIERSPSFRKMVAVEPPSGK